MDACPDHAAGPQQEIAYNQIATDTQILNQTKATQNLQNEQKSALVNFQQITEQGKLEQNQANEINENGDDLQQSSQLPQNADIGTTLGYFKLIQKFIEPKSEGAANVDFAKLLQIPQHLPDITGALRSAIQEKNQDILEQLKEV